MFMAVDDGIFNGYNDLADLCFLIAAIVFGVVFIVRLLAVPRLIDAVAVAFAFMALSIGFLVL